MTEANQCRICLTEILPEEFALNRNWHFDCEKCQICGEPMPAPTRIQECLDRQIPISHITCYNLCEIEKIRTQTIPITQSMLDATNDQILTMRHSYKPPESDIALLQNYLNSLVEAAKNVSWLLEMTKSKIRIDTIAEYEATSKAERKAARKEKAEKVAKETQSAERSAQLAAERKDETGMLRARRKAIESLRAGMPWLTAEEAEKMVEATVKKDAPIQ